MSDVRKIAINFMTALEKASEADFINFLSAFKQMLNNSINASISQFS